MGKSHRCAKPTAGVENGLGELESGSMRRRRKRNRFGVSNRCAVMGRMGSEWVCECVCDE